MFVVSICKENYCHRCIVKFIKSGLSCGDYADFFLVYWHSLWFKWNLKYTALMLCHEQYMKTRAFIDMVIVFWYPINFSAANIW